MTAESPGCATTLIPIFKLVSQNQVMVIERLGRYHRLAESGVNIIWPFLDNPREMTSRFLIENPDGSARVVTRRTAYIDLREQVLDFPRQSVITSDNVAMEINALLYYRIIDPIKAVYEVANFAEAIEKLLLRLATGDGGVAMRAMVGPILPPTPSSIRSPRSLLKASTNRSVGRLSSSSSSSTLVGRTVFG